MQFPTWQFTQLYPTNCHNSFITLNLWAYWAVFPLSRFFSANRRFVGARANNFWQYSKYSFRKFDKFVEIWHLVYFNTGLVQNLGHINVFLGLWAQLLQENLGTRRLAIKLKGTQLLSTCQTNLHHRSVVVESSLNISSFSSPIITTVMSLY